MKNVSLHLLRYREAARHLWNGFLRDEHAIGLGPLPAHETLDAWGELQRLLFQAIVQNRIAPGLAGPRDLDLRVVPSCPSVPAMVSWDKSASGYWDHPVTQLGPDDALRFIEFFDFDQSGFLDFGYYRVAIQGSRDHPDLVGHEALVEVQYAQVFVAESPT